MLNPRAAALAATRGARKALPGWGEDMATLWQTPVVAVCGTRPEAIKLAPVVKALREKNVAVRLVLSGQHPHLAPSMLKEAGVLPDDNLGIFQHGGATGEQFSALVTGIGRYIARVAPALVIVQGDTLTAAAGAMAAFYARVPVAHVEAGLRTGRNSEPFPEEMHRTVIARIADIHFAPTQRAADCLLAEGILPGAIHVTGNTGIDALMPILDELAATPALGAQLSDYYPFVKRARHPLIVATVHRRENIGQRLQSIAAAFARLAGFFEAEIVLPLHPNPIVRAQLKAHLGHLKGCYLIEPIGHRTMVWMLKNADLLVTDSGDLQEEAATIGVRTLVLREATERVESIEQGVAHLVELSADAIVRETRAALARPKVTPTFLYGDGQAARRIAGVVQSFLDAKPVSLAPEPNSFQPRDFA